MATRGPLTRAVATALRNATVKPEDGAAKELVRRYARLIDDAQELADAAALIEAEDDDQAKALRRLQLAFEARTVASDLGPKLLAALTALGMTPAGRGAKGGAQGGGSGLAARLDEFTARRARKHGS